MLQQRNNGNNNEIKCRSKMRLIASFSSRLVFVSLYLIWALTLIHVVKKMLVLIQCSNNGRAHGQWIHVHACRRLNIYNLKECFVFMILIQEFFFFSMNNNFVNIQYRMLPWLGGPFCPFGLMPSDCKFGISILPRF